jgi:hypothetical protein
VRLAPDKLLVRERPDLARFNQNNAIGILHFAVDQQKSFLSDYQAKPLK